MRDERVSGSPEVLTYVHGIYQAWQRREPHLTGGMGDHDACPSVTSPPSEIAFDSNLGMWVLSRYNDVLAAMLEPALRLPVSAKKPKNLKVPDEGAFCAICAPVC